MRLMHSIPTRYPKAGGVGLPIKLCASTQSLIGICVVVGGVASRDGAHCRLVACHALLWNCILAIYTIALVRSPCSYCVAPGHCAGGRLHHKLFFVLMPDLMLSLCVNLNFISRGGWKMLSIHSLLRGLIMIEVQ